jgi:hypothetical protein
MSAYDPAEDRATAGRLSSVRNLESTDATAVTLTPGWWALQAYDGEVYFLTGDKVSNWSDDRAWRQDPNTEPLGIYIPSDDRTITYKCSTGATARIARRSLD